MRPFRFNITVLTCALGLLLTAGASRAETEIIYVDRNATYPYTGQSWCWAYHTIQEALDAADSEADTEIRVADGVYIPTLGNGRLKTFKLQDRVAIRGGYAGCGAGDPDARDFIAYETILSGDLLLNDDPAPTSTCCNAHDTAGCDSATCETLVCVEGGAGTDRPFPRPSCCSEEWDEQCVALAAMLCCSTCGNTCDNSHHVITAYEVDNTAIVDGCTITGGFADVHTALKDRGAGVFNYNYLGNPIFTNCIIRGNIATGKAAGVYNTATDVTFTDCVFSGNIAPFGAAMGNYVNGNPTLTNCTIAGNTATDTSGGIWNVLDADDSPTLINCILWGNFDSRGTDELAQINFDTGGVVVDYSLIQGFSGAFTGTGSGGGDPLFVDAAGPDAVVGTADDDLRLGIGSAAINTGDPSEVPDDPDATDVAGAPRLQGCRVDRGAYESDTVQSTGDFDADGVLRLEDYVGLVDCLDSAGGADESVCWCTFDHDDDEDVDLADFAAFQSSLDSP